MTQELHVQSASRSGRYYAKQWRQVVVSALASTYLFGLF
jgi:hypothetical protein